MTWRQLSTRDKYYQSLYNFRNQSQPIEWNDVDRGLFIAMVEGNKLIWSSSSNYCKDDILNAFTQITDTLKTRMEKLNVWAVVEKWCWIIEMYMRTKIANPPVKWRYHSCLKFLEPFTNLNYPYLGSLPMERLVELTEKYETKELELVEFLKSSESFEVSSDALFAEELGGLKPEQKAQVQPKRNGRKKLKTPTKTSSQAAEPVYDASQFDEIGFSEKMYATLIDLVRETPQLWHTRHADINNAEAHAQTYAKLARKLYDSCATSPLVRIDALHVGAAWTALKQRFYEKEESGDKDWPLFSKLHFLSHRVMPAILFDQIKIEPMASTSSQNTPSATTTTSSSSSSQPFSQKSIHAVIENMVKNQRMAAAAAAMSMVTPSATTQQSQQQPEATPAFITELQKILTAGIPMAARDTDTPPPAKRSRDETSNDVAPATSMVVVQDSRNSTPTTISTWVPPKEELGASTSTATSRTNSDSDVSPAVTTTTTTRTTPRRACTIAAAASAAASSNVRGAASNLRKSTTSPTLRATSITMQNPAIAQALLNPNPATTMLPMIAPVTQAPKAPPQDGALLTTFAQEDKWTLLGKFIATVGREVEQRDKLLGSHLSCETLNLLNHYQIRSLGGEP